MQRSSAAAEEASFYHTYAAEPSKDAAFSNISIWFQVTLPNPPSHLEDRLSELAEPEFRLRNCTESGRLEVGHEEDYCAHWHCVFSPLTCDAIAPARLLGRLAADGLQVLCFRTAGTA